MKKIMWFAAMIPMIMTSVVIQFMPDRIPMHYDLAGNIDRWGSKAEEFVFPVVILFVTLGWYLMIRVFEKKALKAETEKEQMEAGSNAKILCLVGLTQAVMFGTMHGFSLYSSYMEANTGSTKAVIDIAKVSCILCGAMLIVIGNYLTKSRINSTVGLRTAWSMHNDTTWRKSNRFCAISLMAAGLLTIVTTVFASGVVSTVLLLVYILLATIVSCVYSKKVYDREIRKDS
ncbi:MAG: SdpI family protein [Lachnospiraceae bacterium]